MGASMKWALLANAYDNTNIRDKLVKEFSSKLDFSYTPDEKYVDLYLNGEYNGLYLIAEKVDVEKNRLDISEDSVLATFEYAGRFELLDNPFVTDNNQTMDVKYPSKCTEEDLNIIQAYVQQMEDAILTGNDLEEIIDIDSWARMYLVEEVFEDLDVCVASSYYYWTWDEGKIYRGPVWDYDFTLANNISNSNPLTFYAKREWRSDGYYTPYYNALLKNNIFRKRMEEIYYTEFSPLLEELVDGGIEQLWISINKASEMNTVRWGWGYEFIHRIKELLRG
jgi:hypothetical protein